MTITEFTKQRFGAGMICQYKGGGPYNIKGADWEKNEILIETNTGEKWVSYKEVEIL